MQAVLQGAPHLIYALLSSTRPNISNLNFHLPKFPTA